MKSLSKKKILITGAASGIGKALAIEAASLNCFLVLVDRDESGLIAVEKEIRQSGKDCKCYQVDLSIKTEIIRLAMEVEKDPGTIDILINNAGMTTRRMPFLDLDDALFQKMMHVNLHAVIECTRAFLPGMLKQGSGQIANVSSIYAMLGVGQRIAYCTAKFAVRGFTETLRQELRGTGIGVTSVLPGGVRTNITRNQAGWEDREEQEKAAKVTDRASMTSPAKAARKILRGIRKNRARILIGPDAKILDLLVRILPASYHGIVDAVLTRAEKKMMKS